MNRHGLIKIFDDSGRERERYNLTYGAQLKVEHGSDACPRARMLGEWDPYAIPILTEVDGVVKYGDIVDGVTMEEKLDEVTGLSRRVIIESRDASARPRVSIKDARRAARPSVPAWATTWRATSCRSAPTSSRTEGQSVEAGEVIAKIPRETTKTKDITGGLPRVAELFEARKPKDHAIVADIDGIVNFGKDTKGKRKLVITPEVGEPREYLIAKGRHLTVKEGDRVKTGEAADGRSGQPARHPARQGREGAGRLARERNPAGLPPAGREHPRQAHRSDRSPDAASRAHQGGG